MVRHIRLADLLGLNIAFSPKWTKSSPFMVIKSKTTICVNTPDEIPEADSDVVLQPGVGYVDLNEELQNRGLCEIYPCRHHINVTSDRHQPVLTGL
jgi:hypothetical protein